MLKVHTLPLGSYQTNTYIVHNDASDRCVIIDPGYEAGTILGELNHLGLKAEAILLTHGHFDHVGAVEELVEATGCKLWMSESDWSQPIDPIHTHYFPIANSDFTEVLFCKDQEEIRAAGLTFTVYATPGHTAGSVCYACEDALFTGDTLFAGSCGRTDLPSGSWSAIQVSLHRLAQLEGDFAVYPGHGGSSTLANEKKYNPYMR
ncbi:MAG: MBL fold metallo-hydrolase [Oscillospiraceae bacterium]|nr:MBL fold metallo-hydrolase [Oscillospiraceae bacterium]